MLRPQSAAGGTHLFTGRVPLLRPYFSAVCPIIVPRNGREAERLTVVYVDSVFVLPIAKLAKQADTTQVAWAGFPYL